MDLNDTPEQARHRAKVRAWLEQHAHEAPVDLGQEDAAYIQARRCLAGQAGGGRPGRRDVADGVRRAGPWPGRARHRRPGDRARRRARDPRRDRHRDARADDHRARHRGAEEPLPRSDAARRRGLVSALLRARGRLGPRRGAGARGRTGGRQLAARRARRSGRRTPTSPHSGCCSRGPTPTSPKHKGLTMFIVPMDADGVTIRGAAPDLRRGGVQRGLLRRRRARRRRGLRPGRRRLGHGADDADVRAPDDRARLGGASATAPSATPPRSRATRTRAPTPTCGAGSASCASSCSPCASPATACSARWRRARSPVPRPAWRRSRRCARRSTPAT